MLKKLISFVRGSEYPDFSAGVKQAEDAVKEIRYAANALEELADIYDCGMIIDKDGYAIFPPAP